MTAALAMPKKLPVMVRAYEPDLDANFILKAWKRTYRNGSWCPRVPQGEYYALQSVTTANLLARATTRIACFTEDPEINFGFLTFDLVDDLLIVHYLYVKHDFRRSGVAWCLVADAIGGRPINRVICSHQTSAGWAVAPHLFPGLSVEVNPYLAHLSWPAELRMKGPKHGKSADHFGREAHTERAHQT